MQAAISDEVVQGRVLIKASYYRFKVSKIEINDGDKLESEKLYSSEMKSQFNKRRIMGKFYGKCWKE